ncbi:tandem-95 repeat protein [Flexibacterium corallicola]|uniref:tandem-95 repeat protein n=1 Tax=Flexibacterium corallicola TaxID=3037259 RepID=UPI00286F3E1A|nr:tandem-95 repeat protein [Pseudovibrio sp. M1P-2-3]
MSITIGSNRDDTITTTDSNDLVVSGNGDDTVDTGAGDDVVLTGNGDDTVDAGDGDDVVLTGKGDDTVDAGDGDDVVLTGKGDDTVDAGDGDDVVLTGKGDDTVDAGDGDDVVLTGNGDDTVDAGDGDDVVLTGKGDDTVIHIEADNLNALDVYYGGSGWDRLVLVVSQSIYESDAFQADLNHFQSMIDSTGSSSGMLSSLGIEIHSFEEIEVVLDDRNTAPTATAVDLGSLKEDGTRLITALELLNGASDAEGDPLIITSLDIQSGGGSLNDNGDGTWTYQPAADDDSAVTFAYTVSDGQLDASSTATLDLTAVNDAPEASDGSATVLEDGTLSGALPAATDVDGDAVSYSAGTTAPANGAVTINADGSYTYTPDADFNGTDSFSYTVSDGNGGENEYTFTVTVDPVNDAPVTADSTQTTAEDSVVSGTLSASDIDSTALTFALLSGPANGTITLDALTGAYTYTPGTDYNGSDSFTYSVSDGALEASATVSLSVTTVNDRPVATAVSLGSMVEDGSRLIVAAELLAGASDVDGDPLSLTSLTIQSGGGSLNDNGDGTWTYQPAADDDSAVTFAYTVSDGQLDASSTATLDLTAVNDAPEASDGSATVLEDDTLSGALPAAIDVDGDVVSYSAGTTAPANGAVTINADGSYTYSPVADFNGTDTFSYIVFDGNGGENEYTFTVEVSAVNDAPVTADSAQTTAEDTAVSGTLSASDIDSTALTFALLSGPANGTITLDALTGAYTYTPGTDYNGSDSFTYSVSDGALEASATVSLSVTTVNDRPVATAVSLGSMVEDGSRLIVAAELLAGASDVDGDPLSLTSLTIQSGGGSLNDNGDGTWTYQPAADDDSAVTFAYTVSDGQLDASSTATLDLTPVNDAPEASDGSATVLEDGTLSGLLPRATDVDGDAVSYAVGSTAPGNGTVTINAFGDYTYTPDADFSGTDTFSYTVSDGNGGVNEYTFTVDVRPINDRPEIEPLTPQELTENNTSMTLNGVVPVNDPDLGDTLSVTVLGGNAFNNGSRVDQQIFAAELLGLLDIVSSATVSGSGPTALNWTFNADPAYFDYLGERDNFRIEYDLEVSDGIASTFTILQIEIQGTNDTPVAFVPIGDQAFDEDTAVAFNIGDFAFSDAENDGVIFDELFVDARLSDGAPLPQWLMFDHQNGEFTGTPPQDFSGDLEIRVEAQDPQGASAEQTFTLSITPVNDAPVAENGSDVIDEDRDLSGLLPWATDVDGDAVSYAVGSTAPGNGTVTINAFGDYTYTPDADFSGTDTFSYTVSDGNGGVNEYTFTVDVRPINDRPEIEPLTPQELTENNTSMTLNGVVPVNDPDLGDTLSVTVLGGNAFNNGTRVDQQTFADELLGLLDIASSATVSGSGPTDLNWTFNGDPAYFDYLGERDNFRIEYDLEVSDGTTSTITILQIEIQGTNDAPVAFVPIGDQAFDEDTAVAFNIGEFAFSDAENDGVIFDELFVDARLSDGAPLPQWLMFDHQNGEFTGTPPQDFSGDLEIRVEAQDPQGASAEQTFTLSITPVNDAPVAENGSDVIDEDRDLSGLLPRATDVDGDAVSYAVGSIAPGNGTVTINAFGDYTYIPDADFNGSDVFSYTVSDGNGGVNEYTFTVEVRPVNDAPEIEPLDRVDLSENNTSMTLNGAVQVNDPDLGNTLSVTVLGGNAFNNGSRVDQQIFAAELLGLLDIVSSATVSGSGPTALNWTFNADPAYFDYLGERDNFRIEYDLEVSDGIASTFTILQIEIQGTNDTPVAFVPIGDQAFDEDTAVAFNIGDFAFSDAENDGVIFDELFVDARLSDGAPLPQWLMFDHQNGEFTGTPPQDFSGDLEIRVEAQDPQGASAEQTFTLSITPVNDAPVAENGSDVIDEDRDLSGLLPRATDVDGDAVSYAVGSIAPGNGTVTINAFGDYTYIPDADFNGSDVFSYTVSDGNGGVNEYTFTVEVRPVNDAPEIEPLDRVDLSENNTSMTLNGAVQVNDPDLGDTLSLSVVGGNAYSNGVLQNSPSLIAELSNMLSIASSATVSGSGPAAFNWTFNGDTSYFDYLAEGDIFRIEFDLEVSDGTALPALQPLVIEVRGTNDAPIVFSPIGNQSFEEDTAVAFNIGSFAFADAETGGPIFGQLGLDAMLAGGAPLPQWLVFNSQTGDFSGTPPQDFNGDLEIEVRATDALGATSPAQTFTLSITPVNDDARAVDDDISVNEDTSINVKSLILANDYDVEGDLVDVTSITVLPTNGTIELISTPQGHDYTYTPDENFTGQDSFVYRLLSRDPNDPDTYGTVTINVLPVNDAPEFEPLVPQELTENNTSMTLNGAVQVNDPDLGDTLSLSVVGGNVYDNGTLQNSPSLIAELSNMLSIDSSATVSGSGPAAFNWTFNGDTSYFDYLAEGDIFRIEFDLEVSDGTALPALQPLVIEVRGTNDAPIVFSPIGNQSFEEDTAVAFNIGSFAFADAETGGPIFGQLGLEATIAGGAPLPQWLTFNSVTGDFSGTPPQDFNGDFDIEVRATDAQGATSPTQTFTLSITPVNDDARAVDDVISVNEDTSINVKSLILANDYDVEGDLVDVTSITVLPTNGTIDLITNSQGHDYIYTPNENFTGQDSFEYRLLARDLNDPNVYGNVTINVLPVNDDPLAIDDSASVAQGGTVTINALNNDSDVDDNQTLSISQITQGKSGAVAINGDGRIAYTPTSKFTGTDSFTYTVSDGNGGTDTATVTVEVLPVVSGKDGATSIIGSKGAEAIIANSEDNVIHSGLGADLVDGGEGTDIYEGTLDELDGDIITNFEQGEILVVRQASFTYDDLVFRSGSVIIDFPDGQSVSLQNLDFEQMGQEYAVIVTPIIGAPGVGDGTIIGIEPIEGSPDFNMGAVNDAISVAEDGRTTFSPLTNDIIQFGVTAEIDSVGRANNGTVTDNGDGTLTYTPDADFSGSDSFSYTFKDAADTSGVPVTYSAIVSVLVEPENDRPVAQDSSGTTLEDVTFAGNLVATDVDGPFLTYALATGPSDGELDLNTFTGVYTYTPNANFFGSDSFTYSVSDGEFSSTATVSLTITADNDRPVATALTLGTMAEDGSRQITATELLAGASDVEGPLLLTSLNIQSGGGSLTDNLNGTWTYTPDLNDDTDVAFLYTVSDGEFTASAVATLDILPENDAPMASNGSATIAEDNDLNGVLPTATDAEGDQITYALATGTSNGSVNINTDGTFVYSPNLNYFGADSFSYTVSDDNGGANTYTYDLTITAVNDKPIAAADTATVAENDFVFIDVLANDSDVDNGRPSLVSVSDPANGVAILNGIDIVYQPDANFYGSDSFTYTIRDSGGQTNTGTVSVTVTSVNDNPVATGESRTILEDTDLVLTFDELLANDSDADNDELTISAVSGASGGAVSLDAQAQTIKFDSGLNFNGLGSFTYTVSDGNGGTDTASVSINITPVNDVPIAIGDSATTIEEQSVTIDVLSNDLEFDGDNLLLLGTSGVDNGTVTENPDGTLTFTPTAGFIGTETFQYSATDGALASQGNVTVTVEEKPAIVLTGNYVTGYSFSVLTDGSGIANGIEITDIDSSDGDDGVTQVALDDELIIQDREIYIRTNTEGDDTQTYDTVDSQGRASWDLIIAGGGNDTIDAMGGWDLLFGGAGNDTLRGNGGIDRYYGNEGDDRYIHYASWREMIIEDNGEGQDTAFLGSLASDRSLGTGDSWRLDVEGTDLNIIYTDRGSVSDPQGVFVKNALVDSNSDGQLNSLDEDVIELFQFNDQTLTLDALLAQEGYNQFNGTWNKAPEASDGAAFTQEDVPLNGALPAAIDADGDTVSYAAGNISPTNGSVTVNSDGSYSYTPNADFFGSDSFSYTVSDGKGGVNEYTFDVTVEEVLPVVLTGDYLTGYSLTLTPDGNGVLITDIDSSDGDDGSTVITGTDELFIMDIKSQTSVSIHQLQVGSGAPSTGADPDLIIGSSGDDNVNAKSGNDVIFGGDGNDQLQGRAGIDRAHGNDGDDVYVHRSSWGQTIIEDNGEGVDTVYLQYELVNSNGANATDWMIEVDGTDINITFPDQIGDPSNPNGIYIKNALVDSNNDGKLDHLDEDFIENFQFEDGTFSVEEVLEHAGYDLESLGLTAFVPYGLRIGGASNGDDFGYSVASAGDVNGDGIDDILIGAMAANDIGYGGAGESYVVFGKDTQSEGQFWTVSNVISYMNGTDGFIVEGASAGDNSGYSVSSAGDVNGDGVDDILIGARYADPNGQDKAGESYVVFGSSTGNFAPTLNLSTLDGQNGFALKGVNTLDQAGYSVASAGDVNGDGIDDILIGAPQAAGNGNADAGETYVVFGKEGSFGASYDLSTLNGPNGFTVSGAYSGDEAGTSVASAGDVNGDGIDDILIGAPGWDSPSSANVGVAHVIYGKNTLTEGNFADNFDLESLDGSNGFTLHGTQAQSLTGFSVSSAGDINGDGIDDILIGAPSAALKSDIEAGAAYVVFGKNTATEGEFAASIDLESLDGTNGFALTGADYFDLAGASVASAGDVNGDGIDDLLIGAMQADPGGEILAGETYLVFGKDTTTQGGYGATFDLQALNGSNGYVLKGLPEENFFGRSVSAAGDLNNDGIDDILIGTNDGSGSTYVVYGGADLLASFDELDGVADGDIKLGLMIDDRFSYNNDPTLSAAGFTVHVGSPDTFDMTPFGDDIDSDDDGSSLSYALTDIPEAIVSSTLDIVDGQLSYDPGDGFTELSLGETREFVFEVTATDQHGAYAINDVTVTVVGINDDPTLQDATYFVTDRSEPVTFDLTVLADDIDHDDDRSSLIYSIATGPSQGSATVDPSSGLLSFNPETDFQNLANGETRDIQIEVMATDRHGGSTTSTVTVSVTNEESGPQKYGFVLGGAHYHKSVYWGANDASGGAVSNAGDVNGDGIDDILIGAIGADPNGVTSAGKTYVVFGQDTTIDGEFASQLQLHDIVTNQDGFVVNGAGGGDRTGASVAGVGDVNEDGIDDFLIEEIGPSRDSHKQYVVFGSTSYTQEIMLDELDGSNGYALNAGGFYGGYVGDLVSSAGDVNGDGIDDIAIVEFRGSSTSTTYVVFGQDAANVNDQPELDSLDGSNGFILKGIDRYDFYEASVASAGDVNGDGIDDLLIGSRLANKVVTGDPIVTYDTGVTHDTGVTYVVFGKDTADEGDFSASMNMSDLDGSNGFALTGKNESDNSGENVSSAGDVNGDGIDDILIATESADEAYLVFGKDTTTEGDFDANFDLGSLNGTEGYVLTGDPVNEFDFSNLTVSTAGDVNNDGVDDILIGVPFGDPAGDPEFNSGETYVLYGGERSLSEVDGRDGLYDGEIKLRSLTDDALIV